MNGLRHHPKAFSAHLLHRHRYAGNSGLCICLHYASKGENLHILRDANPILQEGFHSPHSHIADLSKNSGGQGLPLLQKTLCSTDSAFRADVFLLQKCSLQSKAQKTAAIHKPHFAQTAGFVQIGGQNEPHSLMPSGFKKGSCFPARLIVIHRYCAVFFRGMVIEYHRNIKSIFQKKRYILFLRHT